MTNSNNLKKYYKCSNCGNLVEEDAKSCPKCGAEFVEDDIINDNIYERKYLDWSTDAFFHINTHHNIEVTESLFSIIAVAIVLILFLIFIFLSMNDTESILLILFFIMLVVIYTVLYCHAILVNKDIVRIRKLKFDNDYFSLEDKKRYVDDLNLYLKELEAEVRRKKAELKRLQLDTTIDYVVIADVDKRKSATSTAIRSAAGNSLLGPVGLIAGAASARNKSYTTFVIIYKSGRKQVKKVDNSSKEYKRLLNYLC